MNDIPDLTHTVFIDFETFWSQEYTLRKQSTSEYVRDPRFLVHCAAIAIGKRKTKVIWGHEAVSKALKAIDWTTHALCAQNTLFDGYIMSEVYGIVPCFYFDTKSMAAALHHGQTRNTLEELAMRYGVGVKDDTSLQSTKGMRIIPPEWRPAFEKYNTDDNDQCRGIFLKQVAAFPHKELEVIDLVIRMFCDSVLYVDIPLAREGLAAEMIARRSEILKSGATEEELLSNNRFAELLGRYIDVPTKPSPTVPGKVNFALAQTDAEFTDLQDSENLKVALLVRGRLAAKSTQAETRAYRLIEAGKDGKRLPVGYTYSAALTHRLGGTNKLNLQNLPRVDKKNPKPSDALRRSIKAPPDHSVVVCDSAQIEARVLVWLCGQDDVVDLFRTGQDVYRHFASTVYNKPAELINDLERFIGKKCVLGLGYGTGHRKLQVTLALGIDGPKVVISLAEAKRLIDIYRIKNSKVKEGWKACDIMLQRMMAGLSGSIFGGLIEYDSTSVWLPNGLPIHYTQLQQDEDGNISYNTVNGRKKIYGAKVVENLVQALARIIVFEQTIAIKHKLAAIKLKKNENLRISMMTHDEVVVVAPTRMADKINTLMIAEMRKPLPWCMDLPLNAEGGHDENYSK